MARTRLPPRTSRRAGPCAPATAGSTLAPGFCAVVVAEGPGGLCVRSRWEPTESSMARWRRAMPASWRCGTPMVMGAPTSGALFGPKGANDVKVHEGLPLPRAQGSDRPLEARAGTAAAARLSRRRSSDGLPADGSHQAKSIAFGGRHDVREHRLAHQQLPEKDRTKGSPGVDPCPRARHAARASGVSPRRVRARRSRTAPATPPGIRNSTALGVRPGT